MKVKFISRKYREEDNKMNLNFSEEMQIMYRNILMQQHNIAYASMIAAFSSAAETSIGTDFTAHNNTANYSLDSDIPRQEIECDAEIILVKSLTENLKKLETNLNGLHGKKFGFREVIEMASARPAYPISPSASLIKRRRSLLEETFDSPLGVASPLTPSSDVKENLLKKNRCNDSLSGLDESTTSSHDGELQIDLNETPEATPPMKTEKKTEAAAGEDVAAKMMALEPKIDINEHDATCDEYNPARLRIERMRNIQKKKPKFNIDTLDLTYHSNMARNFPGSENRTEDQQMRRSKNTLAARISRTKNKAYEKMLEEKSVLTTTDNITMKRKIACLRVYASSLMKINGLADPNFSKMWEGNIKDIVSYSD